MTHDESRTHGGLHRRPILPTPAAQTALSSCCVTHHSSFFRASSFVIRHSLRAPQLTMYRTCIRLLFAPVDAGMWQARPCSQGSPGRPDGAGRAGDAGGRGRVAPCVVRIETLGGLEQVEGQLLGSGPTTGLIVAADGYVLSSAFAFVGKPTSILVTLPSGKRVSATIVARDESRMLVLLKVAADEALARARVGAASGTGGRDNGPSPSVARIRAVFPTCRSGSSAPSIACGARPCRRTRRFRPATMAAR